MEVARKVAQDVVLLGNKILALYQRSGGSPLLQQGELDFSPAEKRFLKDGWALALDLRGRR
jgi:hypothetical protein